MDVLKSGDHRGKNKDSETMKSKKVTAASLIESLSRVSNIFAISENLLSLLDNENVEILYH